MELPMHVYSVLFIVTFLDYSLDLFNFREIGLVLVLIEKFLLDLVREDFSVTKFMKLFA